MGATFNSGFVHRAHAWRAVALALGAALCATGNARAQESAATPRITHVTFVGTHGLRHEVLRDSISTQGTRCRGLLLKPLCAISSSSYFVEKHYLDRAEVPRDELRIRVIYFRAGYREARVSSAVTPAQQDEVNVTFTIEEGPATRISAANVRQVTEVLTSRRIHQTLLPRAGELFNVSHITSARIQMVAALWDRGYGDAVIRDSSRIDAATHTAVLNLIIDPAPRTTIDTVLIEGNARVTTQTIRGLLDLHERGSYRRSEMTAAQRRLYETEIFRQTLVGVSDVSDVSDAPDSAKTVMVWVREAPFRAFRVGFGFNTTEFGQGEFKYTLYNWLGSARRLDVRLATGNLFAPQLYGKSIFGNAAPLGIGDGVDARFLQPNWEIGATFSAPLVLDARASLGFGVSTHRRSIPGIVIDRGYGANSSLTWRFANHAPGSLTYQFEETRVEAGDLYFCINFGVCALNTIGALRGTHRLAPLALTALAERSDDPLAPTRGYNVRFALEHASALTASDFRYHRATVDVSKYIPQRRSVLAMHIRAGWVTALKGTGGALGVGDDEEGILHPRTRFFAGGARSVRGFGENQLGPRVLTIDPAHLLRPADTTLVACTVASITDGTCDPNIARSSQFVSRPLGGNTLIEGSIEYRVPITHTMKFAVFVDAGLVRGRRLDLPSISRAAITPGFGIRYKSPIGPVRIDLGIRPNLSEDAPVVTQILGADSTLHLAELKTPKRYNPLEGTTGFLRKITGRLQLHLAIGEAW